MKRNKKFGGLGTATVTPLEQNGQINWTAFSILLKQQIAAGVDGLFPFGTTGGSPTLSHEEQERGMEFVVSRVDGKVPVFVGAGSNSTAEAVSLTRAAKAAGADGVLSVAPYYNKPPQEGIKDHYHSIAEVGLPVILYDIPSRCGGQGVSAQTILQLAEEGAICGLKWASGNLEQLQDVLENRPEGFTVFSGDDNLTYTAMGLGADGVISVLSNLLPKAMVEFVTAMNQGKYKLGREMHYKLRRLMQAMFVETNPIPITTALALVQEDVFQEVFRLPLRPMGDENRRKLVAVLGIYKLLPSSMGDTESNRLSFA